MQNTKFQFRCLLNPVVIYKPEYLFDVEPMRKHPDYVEVDANGKELVKPSEDRGFVTIPLITSAPKAPAKGGKK